MIRNRPHRTRGRGARSLAVTLAVVLPVAASSGLALAAWSESTQLQARASAGYRAPVLVRAPHVHGSAVDSRTLTAVPAVWRDVSPAATISLQWFRCTTSCAVLSGESGPTYGVPAGAVDSGARYAVRETIDNGGQTATAFSLPTIAHTKGSVTLGLLSYVVVNTAPPTVSPSTAPPAVASTVTATDGSWDAVSLLNLGSLLGLDFRTTTRQWLRCGPVGHTNWPTAGLDGCAMIAGATGSSYVVAPADRNHRLRVRVTVSGRPVLGSDSTGAVVSQASGVVP